MLNMDLNNIKAFVVVAETQSFSQAAEILYITQSAVSKRIASMEHLLSTKLFDRIGRRVILTETGKAILPRCRLILNTIDDTAKIIHNLSGEVAGLLSIGTSHHIGLHHLPPILREYVKLYPDVEMDIQFLGSEQVCELVESGDLELGIITLPLTISDKLTIKTVWHDQMHIVVNSQHPLCKDKTIDIQKLVKFNAILPERGTYTRSIIEAEFEKHKHNLHSKISTNYLETIKMMVTVGLGWSVLPKTLIDEDLHIIEIAEIHISRNLGMIQHKQRTLSNAARAIVALLDKNTNKN